VYRTYIGFHNRLQRGDIPIVYILLYTDMGTRAYAEKELGDIFTAASSPLLFNGGWTFDGSYSAGSGTEGVIERSGRILSISGFERTIQPRTKNVLNSLTSKQAQYINITFSNTDHHFSKMVVFEPLLTKELGVYLGFDDDPFAEHLLLFKGIITEYTASPKTFQVTAEER